METELIGVSQNIRKIKKIIDQVADTELDILVIGETGVGKELVVRRLYQKSKRVGKPFIKVNCAALPDTLLESEMFGYERGAFTGAHVKKLGKFELADGGTMLLDEIGELPLPLQAKLLRVLQENMYERVGGTGTIRIDVRILCSTSKDLERAVESGCFRQDLFYRLNVIPILLPPLRERKEDIPALVNHFLDEFSLKRGFSLEVSPEAMRYLIAYDYPGNVRELKNIIERVSVLATEQVIKRNDLPSDLTDGNGFDSENDTFSLSQAMAKTEKQMILKVLAQTKGKKGEAADLLGISRKNLWEKLKHHKLSSG